MNKIESWERDYLRELAKKQLEIANSEEMQKKEKCPGVIFNQNGADFSKYILSLRLPNVRSEIMLNYLSSRDIYISSGAACSAKNASSQESTRVLLNYGLDKFSADFTVRVSFSKYNNIAELDGFTDALAEGIAKYAVY